MIELELPFPPSVNKYYRRVGSRVLISRGGRAFREKVCSITANLHLEPLKGKLKVHVELYLPDKQRRDLDNVQKSLFDAMEHGGVYKNDCQIVELKIKKCGVVAGGQTIVRLWELQE